MLSQPFSTDSTFDIVVYYKINFFIVPRQYYNWMPVPNILLIKCVPTAVSTSLPQYDGSIRQLEKRDPADEALSPSE